MNPCCLSLLIKVLGKEQGHPPLGWVLPVVTPASLGQLCSLSPPPLTHRLPRLWHGQLERFPWGPASWPPGPAGTWRRPSEQRAALQSLPSSPCASCAQLGPDLGLSSVLAWRTPPQPPVPTPSRAPPRTHPQLCGVWIPGTRGSRISFSSTSVLG